MLLHMSDDDRLNLAVLVVALLGGLFWFWNWRAKKWLEKRDRLELEGSALEWLPDRPQQKPQLTKLRYSEQEFRESVAKVLDELPKQFGDVVRREHSSQVPINAVTVQVKSARSSVSGYPTYRDLGRQFVVILLGFSQKYEHGPGC